MIVTNNSPLAGSIAWQDVVIKRMNVSYNVANGSTALKYVWWDFTTPTVLIATDTQPVLEDNDALIFINNSGTYRIIWSNLVDGAAIVDNTIGVSAINTPNVADMWFDASGNWTTMGVAGQFVFTAPWELVVEENTTLELFAAASLTLTEVFASVKIAPTGDNIIIDIHKNGTTIFTTQSKRPEIVAGSYSDTSDTPDVVSLVKNDKLTMSIDRVGSILPGEDLTVCVRFTQNVLITDTYVSI